MVVGSGIRGVGGMILLYKSRDLVEWDYVHPACTGKEEETGRRWECPNFFPLGGKHVLIVSPIPLGRAIYFLGAWKDQKFTPEVQGEVDEGGCFHAPQTFADSGGRRIMFGWVWEKRSKEVCARSGWSGVQSLPHVLTRGDDGKLRFEPASEVEALRGEHQCLADMDIQPGSRRVLEGIAADCLEMIVELNPGSAARCGLCVRRSLDAEEESLICYDQAARALVTDCTHSSTGKEAIKETYKTAFRLGDNEKLRLRIFLDRSVMEVFANNRACLTSRIYPAKTDSLGVAVFAEGGVGKLTSMYAWHVRTIWNED